MKAVYFLTQRKEPGVGKGSKLNVMRWEIRKLASNFNCNDLLFAHAWCVCVTQHSHYIRKVSVITISGVKLTEGSNNSILDTS